MRVKQKEKSAMQIVLQGLRDKKEGLEELKKLEVKGLYKSRALAYAIQDGYPVYIVGDAAAAESLIGLHRTATTTSEWDSTYAKAFTGASVIILQDRDDTDAEQEEPEEEKNGIDADAAEVIMRDLRRYAHAVKIVDIGEDITDYLTKHSWNDLQAEIDAVEYTYAPWIIERTRGRGENLEITRSVHPATLAQYITDGQDYLIVRNPVDDKDLTYLYRGGVYTRCNRNDMLTKVRSYVPVALQKSSQIMEACSTLYEAPDHVHAAEDLDTSERYINFRNCLVDVKTMERRPHTPELLSTYQIGYDYDPAATKAPVFSKFIDDLCTGQDGKVDEENRAIIQEFGGLLISPIHIYKVKKALCLCSKRGDTGKTVLIKLLTEIIGQRYVTTVPFQSMNEERGRFAMGTIQGKRMITNGDQTKAEISDSSYFKQLTGGDLTKMEEKGKQIVNQVFKGGIVMACNGLPYFKDDQGDHVYRRLLIVPCVHGIDDKDADREILEKMIPEIPAIINWFLEGLKRLLENGLRFSTSKSAEEAKKQYREQMDTVYRFLQEYVTPNGYRYEVTKQYGDVLLKVPIYEQYAAWCADRDVDVDAVRRKNFAGRMAAYGVVEDKGNAEGKRNAFILRGIRLVRAEKPAEAEVSEETAEARGFRQMGFIPLPEDEPLPQQWG